MTKNDETRSESQTTPSDFDAHAFVQRTAPEIDGTEYEYDATIGLLSYNDEQLVSDLLESIERYPHRYKYEWLLSYNGAAGDRLTRLKNKYPYLTILENGANLGVAAGRNRLFWNSRAKYTMILDSDTLVHNGTIDTLIDTIEKQPHTGILAPKLVYRDQRLQLSARPFPKFHHILIEGTSLRCWFEWTGVPARVDMRNVDHHSLMRVDCIYGAAMLIRNRVTRQVGGFDEGYYYQYEDYDLCYRFGRAGFETWYQPAVIVTHFYERENRGVFHPRLKTHIKSILRFQVRNMWGLSRTDICHRRDLDNDKVPSF